jgi:hypothetical protein
MNTIKKDEIINYTKSNVELSININQVANYKNLNFGNVV